MPRNLPPRSNPHPVLLLNMLHKVSNSREPPRFTRDASMETNRHHLRMAVIAFAKKHIKGAAEIVREGRGRSDVTGGDAVAEVVAIVAVVSRQHQHPILPTHETTESGYYREVKKNIRKKDHQHPPPLLLLHLLLRRNIHPIRQIIIISIRLVLQLQILLS